MDKRQILALLGREVFCRATHVRHPIELFIQAWAVNKITASAAELGLPDTATSARFEYGVWVWFVLSEWLLPPKPIRGNYNLCAFFFKNARRAQ